MGHGGLTHEDQSGSRENFFNLVFPLIAPENEVVQLELGGYFSEREEDFVVGPVNLRPNVGLLVSGDTTHATTDFDFRGKRQLRVNMSVYIADLKDDKVADIVAQDGTAYFPPKGDREWIKTQKGRHWSKDGKKSMSHDTGRLPFTLKDEYEQCPLWAQEGKCESDLART
jgi:hypothetical protein